MCRAVQTIGCSQVQPTAVHLIAVQFGAVQLKAVQCVQRVQRSAVQSTSAQYSVVQ